MVQIAIYVLPVRSTEYGTLDSGVVKYGFN